MNMLSLRTLSASVLLGLAALSAGCERDKAATSAPTQPTPNGAAPTMKTTVENEAAIKDIARTRCERETRCSNVGDGKKYASAAACTTEIEGKFRKDLNASECKGGVVKKELEECLGEIKNNDCNNPKDAIEQLAACRTTDLCKAM